MEIVDLVHGTEHRAARCRASRSHSSRCSIRSCSRSCTGSRRWHRDPVPLRRNPDPGIGRRCRAPTTVRCACSSRNGRPIPALLAAERVVSCSITENLRRLQRARRSAHRRPSRSTSTGRTSAERLRIPARHSHPRTGIADTLRVVRRTDRRADIRADAHSASADHLVSRRAPDARSMRRLSREQKKAVIESECYGLLEYVESSFSLDMVAGHDGVKDRLRRAAQAITGRASARRPDGLSHGRTGRLCQDFPRELLHRRDRLSLREVPEFPVAMAGRHRRQPREDPRSCSARCGRSV